MYAAEATAPEAETAPTRKVAIICSKGGLDEAYPALILANAARMSGIEMSLLMLMRTTSLAMIVVGPTVFALSDPLCSSTAAQ